MVFKSNTNAFRRSVALDVEGAADYQEPNWGRERDSKDQFP